MNYKDTDEFKKSFQRLDEYFPCTYTDRGGIKRISFTWFNSYKQAQEYFQHISPVEWPAKRPTLTDEA